MRRLIIIAAAGVIGACSNAVDTTDNCLPVPGTVCGAASADVAVDTGTPPDPDAVDTTCGCLTPDAWYRFTTLTVTSLDGDPKHPAINALNPVWIADIAKYELNILFHNETVSDTEIKATAMDGARVGKDGAYCTLPNTKGPIEHVRSGCTAEPSKPTFLNVYAGNEESPKNCSPKALVHAIPVDNVVIAATHSGSCGDPATDNFSGHITGVIPTLVLDTTCTCLLVGAEQYSEECGVPTPGYIDEDPNYPGACNDCGKQWHSLLGLLKALGGGKELKADCKTIAGEPAICIEAEFVASRVVNAPPECGK